MKPKAVVHNGMEFYVWQVYNRRIHIEKSFYDKMIPDMQVKVLGREMQFAFLAAISKDFRSI